MDDCNNVGVDVIVITLSQVDEFKLLGCVFHSMYGKILGRLTLGPKDQDSCLDFWDRAATHFFPLDPNLPYL